MRVLIADDEERYRDYLGASVSDCGYEVRTAGTGRSAIDIGIRFRPRVLVADWLLLNGIHGLQVSETLRALNPAMGTVLMTGFPSSDLREEAGDTGVHHFLEKPFNLKDLTSAIDELTHDRGGKKACFSVASVELNESGRIDYANEKARALFAPTHAGRRPETLEDLFGQSARTYLEDSARRWTEVVPQAPMPMAWWARSRLLTDSTLLVLVPETEKHLCRSSCVQSLLDTTAPESFSWPFDDHVLIVDNEEMVRRLYGELLTRNGCVCYKAETHDLAFRLFQADSQIGIVLLDYEMPEGTPHLLVEGLRVFRPDVTIVGQSGALHRQDFLSMGVPLFLAKPWRVQELIELLGG